MTATCEKFSSTEIPREKVSHMEDEKRFEVFNVIRAGKLKNYFYFDELLLSITHVSTEEKTQGMNYF